MSTFSVFVFQNELSQNFDLPGLSGKPIKKVVIELLNYDNLTCTGNHIFLETDFARKVEDIRDTLVSSTGSEYSEVGWFEKWPIPAPQDRAAPICIYHNKQDGNTFTGCKFRLRSLNGVVGAGLNFFAIWRVDLMLEQ